MTYDVKKEAEKMAGLMGLSEGFIEYIASNLEIAYAEGEVAQLRKALAENKAEKGEAE